MTASTIARPLTAEILVRALHQRRLSYAVRLARPVLLSDVALSATPPEVCIDEPFGDAPALYVGGRPVPSSDFSFTGMRLSWASGAGTERTLGSIEFRDSGLVGSGLITTSAGHFSVEVALRPVFYDCTLSASAGAHVASGAGGGIELHTANISWDAATWVDAGLRVGYSVTPGSGIGNPPQIVMAFADTATGVTWKPLGSLATMTGDLVLQFDADGAEPDPDDRSGLPADKKAFIRVLPSRMLAELSPDAQTFVGAIVVDETAQPPLVYAVKGTYVETPLQTTSAKPVNSATIVAGATVAGPDGNHLVNMTPFQSVTTPNGPQYTEVVQKAALGDFYEILKYYMPDDMLAFAAPTDPNSGKPVRPTLDPAVASIAAMPGGDGSSPTEWYASMATPYLVQALSTTSDPFAARLNAVRARNWMTSRVATAPVYNTQVPALYAYHFGKQIPEINDFLSDQVSNNAAHAQEIADDAVKWKQQVIDSMSNPKPDDIKAFTDIVDELSQAGADKRYWAYWLFRYMTSPVALAQLQAVSIAPGQNNTAFARQVQSVCATLSVLDPSGVFTRQYAKIISLVQLGNVLPQLLDYKGKADAFSYIIPKLLDAFIARYVDSTDPDIQNIVKELQEAIDQGQTAELINGFLGVAGEITGAYEWRNLTALFEERFPKIAKVSLAVADMITVACAAGGMALFIIGVEDWDSLDDKSKATVVIGGIELFTNMALSLVKRGAAVGQIFATEANGWEALKIILNPFEDNVVRAQNTVLRGTMRRILGEGRRFPENDDYIEMDTYLEMAAEADAPRAMTNLERAFGRNLDEFAIRVGAIFAIVNLVLTAINLADAKDPMEIAENALFLASAAIEIVAYAGGWILGALGVEMIGTIAVATIISACTVVAAGLAVIGLIVMLVLLFEHHPTPIETFATGVAKGAGFYMPFDYDIESFQAYAPNDGPARVAVSLSAGPQAADVLQIGAGGAIASAPLDRTPATCFFLVTNEFGRARFSSVTNDTPPKVLCLSVDANHNLAAIPYIEDRKETSQLWNVTLLEAPRTTSTTTNGETVTNVVSGVFTFSPVDAPMLFLDLSGPTPRLGAKAAKVTITMVPLGPQGLTMPNIELSTSDRDRVFMPSLTMAGSSPRRWTLSPAAPSYLSFDPASGVLNQVLGVAAAVTATTRYMLTCTNDAGSTQTTFDLTVKAPSLMEV